MELMSELPVRLISRILDSVDSLATADGSKSRPEAAVKVTRSRRLLRRSAGVVWLPLGSIEFGSQLLPLRSSSSVYITLFIARLDPSCGQPADGESGGDGNRGLAGRALGGCWSRLLISGTG